MDHCYIQYIQQKLGVGFGRPPVLPSRGHLMPLSPRPPLSPPSFSLPSLLLLLHACHLGSLSLAADTSGWKAGPANPSQISTGKHVERTILASLSPWQSKHKHKPAKSVLRGESTARGVEEVHGVRDFISNQLRSDPSLAVLVQLEETLGAQSIQTPGAAKPPLHSEQSLLEIKQAKSKLASRVASYLAQTAEPYNGLSEPSNNCRTLLNTWMATCVFG